jgi:hypothetical protein
MDFESIYAEYLNALEAIAEHHHELTDTDVRERLREVINYYFVWDHDVDAQFPQKYAMFSLVADQRVAAATRAFIEHAKLITIDVELGDERNYLLQNFDIETPCGVYFDEFIGSTDEALNDEPPSKDHLYGHYKD